MSDEEVDKDSLVTAREEKDGLAFGMLKGTVHVLGDLLAPIDEVWDATHVLVTKS